MRRTLATLLASLALTAASVGSALAHDAGPCGDAEAAASGRNYAEHHIVVNAQAQLLGPVHGHAPGAHQGFSTCVVGA